VVVINGEVMIFIPPHRRFLDYHRTYASVCVRVDYRDCILVLYCYLN
jgi:hypothetical protein